MYDYRRMTTEQQQAVLQERRQRGFPLHAPPHFRQVHGWYLITATCYEHQPIFDSPEDLSWLTDEMLTALAQESFGYSAWVILPNHYHVLLETDDLTHVSQFLRRYHSRWATAINRRYRRRGRQVWYRFSDRLIRTERHYWATVNYVHFNPVKHGYVERPEDWLWSSIHDYLTLYGSEWLAGIWEMYPVKDYGKGWDW